VKFGKISPAAKIGSNFGGMPELKIGYEFIIPKQVTTKGQIFKIGL